MQAAYHVRYGMARHVGRFVSIGREYARGEDVVIRSRRGIELGTIVAEAPPLADADAPILRPASDDDLARARQLGGERHSRFEACRRVFDQGVWPIEPVDVEALLEEGRAILHYLGPRLDFEGLRELLRDASGFDCYFEPVGPEIPEPEPEVEAEQRCESCGSGGCGTGGGCGSGGGCSGCSVGDLVASRRAARV